MFNPGVRVTYVDPPREDGFVRKVRRIDGTSLSLAGQAAVVIGFGTRAETWDEKGKTVFVTVDGGVLIDFDHPELKPFNGPYAPDELRKETEG